MEITTIAVLISIVTGPVAAIIISRWLDKRREIREEKLQIFKDLIAYKDFIPPEKFFLESINLIPIVFYDDKNVTALHHKFINHLFENRGLLAVNSDESVELDPENKYFRVYEENLLNLLNEIAKSLGYSEMRQTDMKKSVISLHEAKEKKVTNEFLETLVAILKRDQNVNNTNK